jgi:2Fe-2S ferredoxin
MSERVANSPEVDLSKPPAEGMVRVTFLPEGRTVEFAFDTLPYEGHGQPMSFLDVAQNYGIFLDHACGGVCACTTCHLHVKQGAEGTSAAEDLELDRLETAAGIELDSRLGCGTMCRKASRRMDRGARAVCGSPFSAGLGLLL